MSGSCCWDSCRRWAALRWSFGAGRCCLDLCSSAECAAWSSCGGSWLGWPGSVVAGALGSLFGCCWSDCPDTWSCSCYWSHWGSCSRCFVAGISTRSGPAVGWRRWRQSWSLFACWLPTSWSLAPSSFSDGFAGQIAVVIGSNDWVATAESFYSVACDGLWRVETSIEEHLEGLILLAKWLTHLDQRSWLTFCQAFAFPKISLCLKMADDVTDSRSCLSRW